jgi:type I restriction-modification system DNA methylase subunit
MPALNQQELESKLWAAADCLLGPVDPTDFGAFDFPLLFLKWISDTRDWDRSQAMDVYESNEELAALPENYRFAVPDGCHWGDLRKVSENVGVALRSILDRLQQAIPTKLAGIFGDVARGNKERLPDSALFCLIDNFGSLSPPA